MISSFLKNLLRFFFIGGLFITVIFLPLTSNYNWGDLQQTFIFNGLLFVLLGFGNSYLADNISISWIDKPVLRFTVSLLSTILFTIAVAVLAEIVIYNWIYKVPIERIFRTINKGYYFNVVMITLVVSTFMHGRAFLLEWRSSIEEAESLKRAHLTSQFENLKQQVNPHFLFNSLNVLTALVHKDADLSEKFIRQLSRVYRYVLEVTNKELIELELELEALEAYVFLIKIRFGDGLDCVINIPDQKGMLIPPLALQMLVENAVKHNIISKSKPLIINIEQIGRTEIVVSNNLQTKNQASEGKGIGLTNINKRYKHLLNEEIKIMESENTFQVNLPVIELGQV